MDGNGNTIIAANADDARKKLIEAMRGLQVVGATLTVWLIGQMPYTIHLDWKTLASLLAAHETEGAQ